jgi:hypothetical protein
MIATDVSGTEKNDRYWASGSGDIFFTIVKFVWF